MKKLKLTGKLSLNKETVARLNDSQMNHVKGGYVEAQTKQKTKCKACCGPKSTYC